MHSVTRNVSCLPTGLDGYLQEEPHAQGEPAGIPRVHRVLRQEFREFVYTIMKRISHALSSARLARELEA